MGFNASSTAAVMTGTLHLKDAAGNELWYVPPMPEGTDAETAAKWADWIEKKAEGHRHRLRPGVPRA
jgi:hypothetical protein